MRQAAVARLRPSRTSYRYVMLVKLAGKDPGTFTTALIKNARKLPQENSTNIADLDRGTGDGRPTSDSH